MCLHFCASQGTEFANIFSHFAPLDWRGPNDSDSPSYYGYVKGRCDTVADAHGAGHCRVDASDPKVIGNEVELDFGHVKIPPLAPAAGQGHNEL